MHYQVQREVTLAERCCECRSGFKSESARYYCCQKTESVCEKCAKTVCKKCSKPRTNVIKVRRCSSNSCKKCYAQDDMFFDFKGHYDLCPKCMAKDYSFVYLKILKDKSKKVPKEVKLATSNSYPYEDLVIYFKQWCFCCANRIGQSDPFEMIKGARICSSCVQLNIDLIQYLLKCIECQGFIHNQKEVFETYENEVDVLCTYCAKKQKEELTKREIDSLQSPTFHHKKVVSALEKSKLKSMASLDQNQGGQKSKMSKVSTLNSFEKEMLDHPVNIVHSDFTEMCEVCSSFLNKEHIFFLKKEQFPTLPYLKIPPNVKSLRLCFLCFGQNFTDRGQTIEFETPLSRGLENQEQLHSSPVKGVKATITSASHGIFEKSKP